MKYTKLKEVTRKEIKKTKIYTDNLFTEEINNILDEAATKQKKYKSKYINELFIYFYREFQALYEQINDCFEYEIIGDIDTKVNNTLYSLNKRFSFLIPINSRFKQCGLNIKYLLMAFINLVVITTGMLLFICINSFISRKPKLANSIILERTKAASNKFTWFKQNMHFNTVSEQLRFNNELYSSVRFKNLGGLIYFLFINMLKDFKFISYYSRTYLGSELTPFIYYYFSKRVPHTIIYEYTLNQLLKSNNISEMYTGNNLDRFALIEEKVCKKNNVKLVNIPHGIEYGYLLPHCFTGDTFYSYSAEGAAYLNNQYKTNKFSFSEKIIKQMLCRNYTKTATYYVFFTEPFGMEINRRIIMKIKEVSLNTGVDFYVKLHPKDKKENYNDLSINYIDDFEMAITNNICIARKSTVLLEAVYNNSRAISVLLNESDEFGFNQFPSLQDNRIKLVYSLERLNSILKNH